MIVGFTGTRGGMTQEQRDRLATVFDGYGADTVLHHGDCFSGETRIITDEGIKTLAELSHGRRIGVLGVGGPAAGSGWTDATVRSFGLQPTLNLTLSRYGIQKEVRTTAGHRWFIRKHHSHGRSAERLTSELREGDRLLGRYGTLQSNVRPSPFGIAHGIVYGDGTRPLTRQPATLDLYGEKDAPLLRYFAQSHTTPTTGGVRVWDLPRHYKDAPSLAESKSYLYGWLAGYFAADGCVASGTVVLSSASRESLAVVEDVCAVLGISVSPVATASRLGYGATPTPLHSLRFSVGSVREDLFLLDHHRRVFEGMRGKTRPADWQVVSVEPTNERENVYCAVVPKGQAFTLQHNILTGNCVGADSEAHKLARDVGWRVVVHPPLADALRGFNQGDETRRRLPYLNRDYQIVDECDVLVAAPAEMGERLRSGTWATVRHARRTGRPHVIVYPDGSLFASC